MSQYDKENSLAKNQDEENINAALRAIGLTAEADQMIAGAEHFGHAIGAFYTAMRAEKVPGSQALEITKWYISSLILSNRKDI